MEIRVRETGQVMFENEWRTWVQTRYSEKIRGLVTPEHLEKYASDPVFEGPQASGGTVYQYSMRQGVENVNGFWYTKYVLGPIFTDTTAEDGTVTTAAENEAAYKAQRDAQQADVVRNTRTTKLAECDWTQLADSPVDKAAWATYRQALRDVPTQAGFPWNVVWPDQPTV